MKTENGIKIEDIKPGKKFLYNFQYPPKPEIITIKHKPYIWYDKNGFHASVAIEEKEYSVDVSHLYDLKKIKSLLKKHEKDV